MKSEISLDTGDSTPNTVVNVLFRLFSALPNGVVQNGVFVYYGLILWSILLSILWSVVQNGVFVYYGLRVCGQTYIIIICDRLRKSCTTVE